MRGLVQVGGGQTLIKTPPRSWRRIILVMVILINSQQLFNSVS